MTDSIEGRLADLETKLSFQEQLLSDLNDVVAGQNRAMADLERQMQLLARRAPEPEGGEPGDEPPPPHY